MLLFFHSFIFLFLSSYFHNVSLNLSKHISFAIIKSFSLFRLLFAFHLSSSVACFFSFSYFLFLFFNPFFVGSFTLIFPYARPDFHEFIHCWYLFFVFWSLICFLVEVSLIFFEDAVIFSKFRLSLCVTIFPLNLSTIFLSLSWSLLAF